MAHYLKWTSVYLKYGPLRPGSKVGNTNIKHVGRRCPKRPKRGNSRRGECGSGEERMMDETMRDKRMIENRALEEGARREGA